MPNEVKATIENDELVLKIKFNDPLQPSKTGHSMVLASSHGNFVTNLMVEGKRVVVGLNAYCRNDK